MEKQEKCYTPHVVVFPLPAQGHINPMIQFSKRLAFKGLKVTLVNTASHAKFMQASTGSIRVEPISVRFEEDCKLDDLTKLKHFQTIVSKGLPELILKQSTSGYPVTCLVYDSGMPWALDIAKQLGLVAASFFTQSCSVTAIYCNIYQGLLTIPTEKCYVSISGLPELETSDLPSMGSYPSLLLDQFSNFDKADWILVNTFDSLEEEVIKWMTIQWRIKTIGPTIPSMYTDKRLEDDNDYGLNVIKPNVDDCVWWLDTKEVNSVVYVSFGSMATLGREQMEELALGLKRSNNYFLWVVRESEMKKLPSNIVENPEKGLVVNWCRQLQVLTHPAVGCFLTHCGWNTTLEALNLGVPMVAMPQLTDQATNAKFVADVWKVGVRVKIGDRGIVSKEEIDVCIREVMEGERGIEFKKNAGKWKELAKAAVDDGGSSDRNIQEFVANIVCSSC